MTYYERIQQAIDYIEEYLGADITVDDIQRELTLIANKVVKFDAAKNTWSVIL